MIYDTAPPPEIVVTVEPEPLTRGILSRRVAGFVIDTALVAALGAVAWLVLVAFGVFTLGLGLPLLGLLPVLPILYSWLSVVSALSSTPGLRLMGLVLRRADDLGPPTPLQAALWVAGFLVTASLGLIWVCIALITERHRTLHDLVSGLVVVRARALTMQRPIWNTRGQHETLV